MAGACRSFPARPILTAPRLTLPPDMEEGGLQGMGNGSGGVEEVVLSLPPGCSYEPVANPNWKLWICLLVGSTICCLGEGLRRPPWDGMGMVEGAQGLRRTPSSS